MHARAKTSSSSSSSDGSDKQPKPAAVASAAAKKSSGSGGSKKAAAKPAPAAAAPAVATATLKPMPEGAALYDEALLEGGLAHEQRYEGDKKFNLRGQSEDVIAPWSVGGFEIDIPDWRPQPSEEYEVDVSPKVVESLGKIENMFGAALRLVSTKDGGWVICGWGVDGSFIYMHKPETRTHNPNHQKQEHNKTQIPYPLQSPPQTNISPQTQASGASSTRAIPRT
jgi:hypothetical protein